MAVATIGAVMFTPSAAQAAFPGMNGLIVFASSSVLSGRWCSAGQQDPQLFALTAGGSHPVRLTCNPGSDQHPFVSPDGSEVVFSNSRNDGPGRLFTIPLLIPPPRRPPHPTLVSDTPSASDDYPSWSPANDGTIVFQRTISGTPSQIYLENVSDPAGAAPMFPSPTGYSDTEPVFDPSDADVVVFVRSVDQHTHIFGYDMATHVLQDLSAQGNGGLPGNDSKPDFAPSGTGGRIVFQSDRMCNQPQLYTMTTQGTDQAPVFSSMRHRGGWSHSCQQGSADPVYSPQGDALAYDQRLRCGRTELFTVSVDSSGTAAESPIDAFEGGIFGEQPNWGPDPDPPAQTPEASLAVTLPVAGVVVAAATLGLSRRRGNRRRRRAI